jgi:superoxide dismutase
MIKLLDIVKEVELQGNKVLDKAIEEHDNLHYRDHLKEIQKHVEKALSTNDPKIINKQLEEIIKHSTSAQDKVVAANGRDSVHSGGSGIGGFHANNADF